MKSEIKQQPAPTRYSLLIQGINEELRSVREAINKGRLQEQALMKSLEIMQQAAFSNVPTIAAESIVQLGKGLQHITSETLEVPGYPYNGERPEKILFILRTVSTAMRIPEVMTEIIRIEGPTIGEKTCKSINYIMNQMVADGTLILGKANKSNKHAFYFLEEFFSSLDKGNVIVKPENMPKAESWGKLPEDKKNFNKTKWIMYIRR